MRRAEDKMMVLAGASPGGGSDDGQAEGSQRNKVRLGKTSGQRLRVRQRREG